MGSLLHPHSAQITHEIPDSPGALAMGASHAPAQAAIAPEERAGLVRNYDIPAGPMAPALNTFAYRSGVHLAYDARLTQRLNTAGLSGNYSVQQGLNRLLAGTGLSYRFGSRRDTVSIVLAQNVTNTRSDARGAQVLPTIDVGARTRQRIVGSGRPGQPSGARVSGPPASPQPAPATGGSYGGAGPAQDPYNKTYVLEKASTGTKTNTPVMDTPLNIQSITRQVLQDQQAITIGEAVRNVSGVFVAPGTTTLGVDRTSGVFLRGFRVNTFYRDGFRIDGTFSELDFTGSRQLANIASIEVLKGPGAMLYGLVEPGGVVNLVTKEPLNAPYYSAQQQIGSLALYRTTADATGPITDDKSWLYRINLSYENNGAPFGPFIDFTHSQNLFVAPVVKWNLDPATWVKLEAEYGEDRLGQQVPFTALYNRAFVTQPRSRNYGDPSPERQTTLFTALTWSHQFDKDWSIKQQIAYNYGNRNTRLVVPIALVPTSDGPAVFRFTDNSSFAARTYSTNIDLIGHIDTFNVKHTILLGGDIYRTTLNTFNNDPASGFSVINYFNPIRPVIPTPGFDFNFASDRAQNTAGLYLQDQIELPYNIFVLAGARYQYVRQEQRQVFIPADFGSPPVDPLKGQAVTPRYGVLWRPQDWVSIYGNYTEGFGPNAGTIYPGVLAPPSNAKSWEAGIKLELLDGRFRTTADYYDLTKTNIPTTDPLHPNFSLLVGEARSKGVEIDVQGEIFPGWNVITSYANQDVRITDDNDLLRVGQRFPGVPRNLASLWTTYEFQDDVLRGLKIGGGYTYTGSQPINDVGGNPPGTFPLLPSYGLVDLMAAYSLRADPKRLDSRATG